MSFISSEQVVVFRVGDQHYGVGIGHISEVILWQQPTPLPGSPPAVLGVIDLRGRTVPVLDLARRFGIVRQKPAAGGRIMVLEARKTGRGDGAGGETPIGHPAWRLLGLEVDEVTEVSRFDREQVEDPGPLAHGTERLVAGVIRWRGQLLVLLDPDEVVRGLPYAAAV